MRRIENLRGGKTSQEISDLINGLLNSNLIKKIGLSNFPLEITESLQSRNKISCLQIDLNSPNLREHVSLYDKMGVQTWIYRPFNQGKVITQQG